MNNGTFGCLHNCGDVCTGDCLEKYHRDSEKIIYELIEDRIIRWNNDGNQTAGFLTREIMALLERRGVKL
jgi:hypothetical protein